MEMAMNESNASSGSIKPQVDLPKCTECAHAVQFHGPHGCRICKCKTAGAATSVESVQAVMTHDTDGVAYKSALPLEHVVYKAALPVDFDADERIKDLEEKLARKPIVKALEDGEIEVWTDDHAHRFSPTSKIDQQLVIIDELQKKQLLNTAHIADLERQLAARPQSIFIGDHPRVTELEAIVAALEHDLMTAQRRGKP